MHFCGVDGDDIARLNRYRAAPAVRGLCAVIYDADAELIMRMARESLGTMGAYSENRGCNTTMGDKLINHPAEAFGRCQRAGRHTNAASPFLGMQMCLGTAML